MKILVTGCEGQLARSLALRVGCATDLELTLLGRPDLDLEEPAAAAAAISDARPDLVINAAAYTAVDWAEDEPERVFRINAEAPATLAVAARQVGAHFIQVSTDYVFAGRDTAYDEDAPTAPTGIYGASKLAGEQGVLAAMPDAAVVRTAWVYSPFGRNFLKTMLRLAETRDEVTVVADQHGCPTAATDLADGLLALARAWRGGSKAAGVFHLAGTGHTSWAGLAEAIMDAARAEGLPAAAVRPIMTNEYPSRASRPSRVVLDCSRFAAATGYVAPDWRRSVETVVATLARGQSPNADASLRVLSGGAPR